MGSSKKVVVIGSGIGGSGAGALLAEAGHDVEIFEKTKLLGGRFASYQKGDFRLDIGCHILGNCDKGRLGEILDRVGEPIEWAYTSKPGPVFVYGHERLKFPSGAARLGFGNEEMGAIARLYTDLAALTETELDGLNAVDLDTFLRRYLDDERLRSIFGYLTGMYFVIPPFETPTGEWVRCQQEIMQSKASGYPIGGTGAIPAAFCRAVERRGGQVHLGTGVSRIVVEDGVAVGVQLDDGHQVEADIVVSNADTKTTVLDLVGADRYPPEIVEKVEDYRFSELVFTVKVALDTPVTDEKLVMYVDPENTEAFEAMAAGEVPGRIPSLMIPVLSNLDPTACPEGKQLLIAGTGCRAPLDSPREVWHQWEAACLASVFELFPGAEDHVLWVDSTSPRWIERMFGEGGAPIGIAQSVGQVGPDRPPLSDPVVANLYHASADSGVHGIGGELAADAALRVSQSITEGLAA